MKRGLKRMDPMKKLEILTDAAKYDAACTSSGSSRKSDGRLGNAVSCGICHSFAADGRCISLLKVLLSNACINDCKYCASRVSGNAPRATFTPDELADITIAFYKRNYIEGLFLSSAIVCSPDHTTQMMIRALEKLRHVYGFNGYIHAKAIPGTSPELITRLGLLVDRLSVNIELPSQESLQKLAPQKSKAAILKPMEQIRDGALQSRQEMAVFRHAPRFAPAGQSTQMIVGASPETDRQILALTHALYSKYALRRVFYSAYVPVGDKRLLPVKQPPLLREHRLYQADWLLRYYGFSVDEITDAQHPHLDMHLDPKCAWALRHFEHFPVEVNRAPLEVLLRVPGIGVKSAQRIVVARRHTSLRHEDLKKLGVVLKRARYFITCMGRMAPMADLPPEAVYTSLTQDERLHASPMLVGEQQTFLTPGGLYLPSGGDLWKAG